MLPTHRSLALAIFLLLCAAPALRAEDPAPTPPPVVVAVLEFQGPKDELRELTALVPRIVESRLAETKAFQLVTRADLDRIQEEQSLSLAGLVDEGKGAQVGRLVGAQILVVGRVSSVDDEVILSAKAIGAETGAFLAAIVRGGVNTAGGDLADQIAQRVKDLLVERGGEVLPAANAAEAEREAALRQEIAKLEVTLPRLALLVPERHVQATPAPDPAAETAMLAALRRLGFAVAPVTRESQRAWLRRAGKGEADFPGPSDLEADLAVVGEAFSEFGGRVGRFVSCRARVEIRVYRLSTGEIVTTWVGTGSGADLSEVFAAKKALGGLGTRGAHEMALDLARSAVPD